MLGYILRFQLQLVHKESIAMDFVGGFPKTLKGNDHLSVVVDRFSKIVVLMPCKKMMTGKEVAKHFFENVWKIFGLPKSIYDQYSWF